LSRATICVMRSSVFVFFLVTVPASLAQSTPPAFDVASVKLSPNCQPGSGAHAAISARNLALPCVSLRGLIRLAYGDALVGSGLGARRMEVEGGPVWLDTEKYDVFAKSETAAAGQAPAPMLQTLLETRFKLKLHKEARTSAAYILTVAHGGSKLQPAKAGSCIEMDLSNIRHPAPAKPGEAMPNYCGMGRATNKGSLMIADWFGVSMAELAGRMLASAVDLPVVDQTGLTERFDVHVEYVPERHIGGPVTLNGVPADLPPSDPAAGPSIFSALEKQLGLKLTPGKAPLDVIIVDRAEKPTAN
jgi:uncharacterized protein (TIGR03435 family)